MCFSEDSIVYGVDGKQKKVYELSRNDELLGYNNKIVTVRHIIRSPQSKMFEIDKGLIITPWHPIREDGLWVFPNSLDTETITTNKTCYNIVLDYGDSEILLGEKKRGVVTLGHGLVDNEIVTHPYFGTSQVVYDIDRMCNEGTGVLDIKGFVRDKRSKLICGIK